MKVLSIAGRYGRRFPGQRGSECTYIPLVGTYTVGGQTTSASTSGPFHLTATNNRASYVELLPSVSFVFERLVRLFVVFHSYAGGAGMGSPRLSIGLADKTGTERPLIIYLGTPPTFVDSDALLNRYSGLNLVGKDGADRFDSSHFRGGSFFETYADTLARVTKFKVKRICFFLDTVGNTRNRDEVVYSIGGSIAQPLRRRASAF